MSKLKEVVRFELSTSLRYLLIFYAIQYSVVAVTLFLTWLGPGSLDHPYFAALETCAMIFVFIFGALGFGEDFKMLLQNGFTRRVHFVAALVLFVVTAMLLALVTATGRFLRRSMGRIRRWRCNFSGASVCIWCWPAQATSARSSWRGWGRSARSFLGSCSGAWACWRCRRFMWSCCRMRGVTALARR